MPTFAQYLIVKQQIAAFRKKGYICRFLIRPSLECPDPLIWLHIPSDKPGVAKEYRFCDPDWEVVSRQLATLYIGVARDEKRKRSQQTK